MASAALMSLAELLARLGTTIVAWLCIYAWLIWTATLRVATCNASGDDLWTLVLGFGVFTSALSLLLGLTRPLPEVHAMTRKFAWPLVLLLPLALAPVWDGLGRCHFHGVATLPGRARRQLASVVGAPADPVALVHRLPHPAEPSPVCLNPGSGPVIRPPPATFMNLLHRGRGPPVAG